MSRCSVCACPHDSCEQKVPWQGTGGGEEGGGWQPPRGFHGAAPAVPVLRRCALASGGCRPVILVVALGLVNGNTPLVAPFFMQAC